MSEALDLSINVAARQATKAKRPGLTSPSSSTKMERPSILNPPSETPTMMHVSEQEFLRSCAAVATMALKNHDRSPPITGPLMPSTSSNTHFHFQPTSNNNTPLSGFVPLTVPSLDQRNVHQQVIPNGLDATNKEMSLGGAVDLRIQSPANFRLATGPFLTVGTGPPQIATQMSAHMALKASLNVDYAPAMDIYSRPPVTVDQKEIFKKFSSFRECHYPRCQELGMKEHFHCFQCHKVVNRREETVRHAKWHRKRAESLQYGFMRFSSTDSCSYPNCSYNLKQTHYHCIQENCTKTYISTSDVQMHANYHRKDAVIIQEGFRRYRASENCNCSWCPYANEHTTHFHCQREGCNFTFKNKADMEKHKNHHLRNDVIAKDGFRKFMKSENCNFFGCKYSGMSNHIHCIRSGCDYVVHSTSQISSHKRKHDRRVTNTAYPCSMVSQQTSNSSPPNSENSNGSSAVTPQITNCTTTAPTSATTTPKPSPPQSISPLLDAQDHRAIAKLLQRASKIAETCWLKAQSSETHVDPDDAQIIEQVIQVVNASLKLYRGGESCENEQCSLHATGIDHFHCFRTCCLDTSEMEVDDRDLSVWDTISFGDFDSWREHWLHHAWQSTLTILGYVPCPGGDCNSKSKFHTHCLFWPSCGFIAECKPGENPVALVRHLIRHNQNFGAMLLQKKEISSNLSLEVGQRKRGRPPKHPRDIHIPRLNVPSERCEDTEPGVILTMDAFLSKPDMIAGGFKFFPAEGPPCMDRCCPCYAAKQSHFHCMQPRCYLATSNLATVNAHRREFHAYVRIEPGYEYFDRSVDCRRAACYAKRDSAHFHCLRPRCGYSFVRISKMSQHTEQHAGICPNSGGAFNGGNSSMQSEELNLQTQSALLPANVEPIVPPLGMERNQTVVDLMPILMRLIAEGCLPPLDNNWILPSIANGALLGQNSTESAVKKEKGGGDVGEVGEDDDEEKEEAVRESMDWAETGGGNNSSSEVIQRMTEAVANMPQMTFGGGPQSL